MMKRPSFPRGLCQRISTALLPWFRENAREMPWRRWRTPYTVWISEAMLQQTRVETVVPYFLRWMERFPDVQALALADVQDVLKVWEGLGYYARARNLQRAAVQILARHGGEFPRDPEDVAALPGIGPYTQAAILSLAFGESFAVLDGNVERVLTRLLAWSASVRDPSVKQSLREAARRLMAEHPPGDFNEAMMELGATVCLPRSPRCTVCPLAEVCRANKNGNPEAYPLKEPKPKIPTIEVGAGVLWRDEKTFLVARRKEKGLLAGLWEFPGGKREAGEDVPACVRRELKEELGIEVDTGEALCLVRHSYSHFHLRMTVLHCQWRGDTPQAIDCADFRWVTLDDCHLLPFSRADLKVIRALEALRGPA